MKVVINTCFGGFGLSPKGQEAYLARQGKQAFFYVEDRSSGGYRERDYDRMSAQDAGKAFIVTTLTENIGERASFEEVWAGGKGHASYWYDRDLKRDDPDLVAVVEELGKAASGKHADLTVVEIPDDVEWFISEYDGLEHIAEKHRTWS